MTQIKTTISQSNAYGYAKRIHPYYSVCVIVIAVLVVSLYWMQQLTPDLYAALNVLLNSFGSLSFFGDVDPDSPIDFINQIKFY